MTQVTESPELEQSQASEDYPLTPVPLTARKPLWSLAPLLMGFALTGTTLFAGGTLGPAFPLMPDLIVLIVVGNLILGAYAAGLGYIAAKTGLSTVLMARFSFGNVGSRWVDFILGFTQIGWYAVATAFIVASLDSIFNFPNIIDFLLTIFFTFIFCATAYMGYWAMDWLSRLAVPAMLVLIAISLTLATRDYGSATIAPPTGEIPVGTALAIIIGTFVSGATQATNWSRFADSGRNAVLGTVAAFTGINALLVFAGAFCTITYNSEDLITAMATQGILAGGIVLLILNIWTTQDNTIYAFSVAGANMFRTTKRHAFVLGGATFALALTLSGIYDQLPQYLLLLGVFIPPVGGIIMADFWGRHRQSFPPLDAKIPPFNWAGVIAYVVGSAIAYWTSQAQILVAPLNGIVVAAVLYLILCRVIKQPIRTLEHS